MADPEQPDPETPSGGLSTGRKGRPPVSLRAKIGERKVGETPDGKSVMAAVTRLDRVREVMSIGGFDKDCAARCGVRVETYREWLKLGVAARADLANDRRTRRDLTAHERQCVELAMVVEEAEAEGRLLLMGVAERLSRGGIEVTTTTEKLDGKGKALERTTKVERTLPDGAMVRWRMERRWPGDFAKRVEVTGPDGGPVRADVPVVEKLLADLARIAGTKAAGEAAIAAHANGNGVEAEPNGVH